MLKPTLVVASLMTVALALAGPGVAAQDYQVGEESTANPEDFCEFPLDSDCTDPDSGHHCDLYVGQACIQEGG